ncbi:alpha-amylase family glycosyl hydrolase [Persicimonas caeni]|uniref:alpha-amylase family glycosyl hydrolase n=1 Tax=Persicimonas caeni TaxID=2292766 RepID=UPI00143CF1E2|nr:alpha-amylase family glycosyl hydrolase [Persicimonas caeni]
MLLLLALLVGVSGCRDVESIEPGANIDTHVEDWRDEVIYQILVDRFANGDPNNDYRVNPHAMAAYHGGDWQGIIDKLDYLEELGVTALWISPVVKNVETDAGVDGYHGYWAQDFLAPNPHFGDLAKLREMVDKAHERDMKVILDIVTNHVGQVFYYDINGNGQPDESVFGSGTTSELTRVSEYDPDYDPRGIQARTSLGEAGLAPVIFMNRPDINRMPPMPEEFQNPDWYYRKGRVWDWNQRDQVLTGDFPGGLKDLKTTHPDVRKALIDVYSYWIGVADFDGFRIDTLKHVEYGFWEEFAPAIRQYAKDHGKDNFLMFGESFDGNDELNGSYTFNGGVDSVFYFSHKFQVIDGVFVHGGPTSQIESLFQAREQNYASVPNANGPTDSEGNGLSSQDLLINFIDNHDIPRFLYMNPDVNALHNALVYLMTIDGIPCIYYGTEQNFEGGNDPYNREDMWDSGYDTENETFKLTKHLIQLRKDLAPLRRGDMQIRWATPRTGAEEDAGIFAFERTYKGETVLVVINTHDDEASHTSFEGSDMQTSFSQGTVLTNVFEDDDTANDQVTVGANGTLKVEVEPRGGKVYVVK